MTINPPNEPALRVAVVGAGIVGLTLAAGLLEHGVDATVYEQASALQEIGTGIGLIPTAVTALEALSPAVAAGMRRVAFESSYSIPLVDGATDEDLAARPGNSEPHDSKVRADPGQRLWTCPRATLAAELLRHVPPERLKLGKRVVDVVSKSNTGPVTLVFADGTTAEADAVVACDGVKSRVRAVLLGASHPAAPCQYAGELCYRTLVSTTALRGLLGPLADSTAFYVGPGVYLIIYPVGDRANISVYVDHRTPPPPNAPHGRVAPREALVAALSVMGPSIRAIANLLPEEVSVWALHDSHDQPLTSYAFGRTCLAGDAAHAATSHLGAGAGVGVEDAAVLCKLLARVRAKVAGGGSTAAAGRKDMVQAAMKIYDEERRERSQWMVRSSRRQGLLLKCLIPEVGSDMAQMREDILARSQHLQDYDVHGGLEKTVRELDGRIAVMEAGMLHT
ncbi:hypothetical protein PWT90_03549 [Aphanocladium album]|nr:hypothetical protein PWT90_03549 [Aphanocladium album]